MAKAKPTGPFKRRKTRHPGISYRLRGDGSRTYSVYFRGKYLSVVGGEQDALARQAELRSQAAKGEAVVLPGRETFAEVAELWFASKDELRPWTRLNYRATL